MAGRLLQRVKRETVKCLSRRSVAVAVTVEQERRPNGVKVSPSKPVSHSWTPTNCHRSKSKWPVTFYSQKEIARIAEKNSTRLTPAQLIYAGKPCDPKYLLRTASYLHKELPIRIAKMVRRFQKLPHIVGLNPHIHSVHELYVNSFHRLTEFKSVDTVEEEMAYSHLLRSLLDEHQNTVTKLAHGFRECRSLVDFEDISEFLNSLQTSRLGIRMLAEHHLALHQQVPGYIGIVQTKLSPKEVIEECSSFASRQCEHRYGRSPRVDIDGQTSVQFAYIAVPLQYILEEVIKNAMRATTEAHRHSMHLPPVRATIISNTTDFTIRVSDVGGGIPASEVPRAWQYMYSTAEDSNELTGERSTVTTAGDDGVDRLTACLSRPAAGPMAGFGYGLPTSRAFAHYLGGCLEMQSMFGYGTDIFLHLKHFDGPGHTFYI